MELVSVQSSNLSKVGYDEEARILIIVFRSGATYEFEDVSKEQVEELLNAPSLGKFFSNNIRSKFRYKKIV